MCHHCKSVSKEDILIIITQFILMTLFYVNLFYSLQKKKIICFGYLQTSRIIFIHMLSLHHLYSLCEIRSDKNN